MHDVAHVLGRILSKASKGAVVNSNSHQRRAAKLAIEVADLRAALALQVQELGKLTSDLARLADRATDNNEHEISAIYASCFMKITQLLPSAAAPVKAK